MSSDKQMWVAFAGGGEQFRLTVPVPLRATPVRMYGEEYYDARIGGLWTRWAASCDHDGWCLVLRVFDGRLAYGEKLLPRQWEVPDAE